MTLIFFLPLGKREKKNGREDEKEKRGREKKKRERGGESYFSPFYFFFKKQILDQSLKQFFILPHI